jgi:hypothetical protein
VTRVPATTGLPIMTAGFDCISASDIAAVSVFPSNCS